MKIKERLTFLMTANKILFLIFFSLSSVAWAQESRVFDSLTLKSNILEKEMAYTIYLPKGYESSKRKYPVLYLLHSLGGNQNSWIQGGDMQRITDNEIKEGSAAAMIIVMPDAERTWYVNSENHKYNYEDYFINELIPHIDKTYRSRPSKGYRAISGLSMGGFGAMLYALHHPDLFIASAAMSTATRTDNEIIEMSIVDYSIRYGQIISKIREGNSRITIFWNNNSLHYLVKDLKEDQKKLVGFYFDIGDDDFLFRGNSLLHIAMRDLNIPHEYRVRNGGHNWEYWKSGLPGVLSFVSQNF